MREISRRSIITGLRIFLAITIVVGMGVLIFSVKGLTFGDLIKRETWVVLARPGTWAEVGRDLVRALRSMRIGFLVLATAFMMGRLYMDILRVQILSKAAGKWMPFRSSAEFNVGGLFLAAVTPFQSGGVPLQLYICRRLGLSIGAGGAVIVFRGVLSAIVFVLVLPIMILFFKEFLVGPVVRPLGRYLIVLYAVMFSLLLLALFRPGGMKRHLLMFDSYLRIKRIVRTDRFERFYMKLFEQIEEFRKSARDYFGRRKALLGAAFLVSCGAVVLNASIAPAILYGLGQTPSVAASFILAVLLLYILAFVPTPGASGFAEVGAYSLFFFLIERNLLGVFVLLWRFFTLYLGAFLGGLLLLRMLRGGVSVDSVFSQSSQTRG